MLAVLLLDEIWEEIPSSDHDKSHNEMAAIRKRAVAVARNDVNRRKQHGILGEEPFILRVMVAVQ